MNYFQYNFSLNRLDITWNLTLTWTPPPSQRKKNVLGGNGCGKGEQESKRRDFANKKLKVTLNFTHSITRFASLDRRAFSSVFATVEYDHQMHISHATTQTTRIVMFHTRLRNSERERVTALITDGIQLLKARVRSWNKGQCAELVTSLVTV